MKISKGILALSLGAATTVSYLQFAPADETVKKPGGANIGALDQRTSGAVVRVSQLIGANIKNAAGQDVGEVQDVVLDSSSGRAQYMAVSYGGFMGLGDKLFAVPYKAFRVQRDPNNPTDPKDLTLILDVTPEKLKGAVGFDENHWPDFANQAWVQGIHKQYGLDIDVDQNPRNGVDININRNGVDVDVK